MKIVRSGHRKLPDGQRIVLGHEFVGVIEQVGSRVAGYRAGQRVGIAPNAGCGQCPACIRGKANYCPAYTAFGIDRDGGHAACVRIPSRFITQGNVIDVARRGLRHARPSLLEPFSCVVNGVRSSRIELGDTVVIYGAGPIGLMHVMLCRAAGAAKLIVIDIRADRLQRARSLGCDLALNPLQEEVVARVRQETAGQWCRRGDHGVSGGRKSSRRPSSCWLPLAGSVCSADCRRRAAPCRWTPMRSTTAISW